MQTEHNPTLKHHVLVLTDLPSHTKRRTAATCRSHPLYNPALSRLAAQVRSVSRRHAGSVLEWCDQMGVVTRNCLYGKKNDRPLERHSPVRLCTLVFGSQGCLVSHMSSPTAFIRETSRILPPPCSLQHVLSTGTTHCLSISLPLFLPPSHWHSLTAR